MEEKKSIKGIKLQDNTSDSGWALEAEKGREIEPRAHPVCTAFPSGIFWPLLNFWFWIKWTFRFIWPNFFYSYEMKHEAELEEGQLGCCSLKLSCVIWA